MRQFKTAIKRKDRVLANKLFNRCSGRNTWRAARRTTGRAGPSGFLFKSQSLGLSASAGVIVGGAIESGFVWNIKPDDQLELPYFYSSKEWSLGITAGISSGLVTSFNKDPAAPGVTKYKSGGFDLYAAAGLGVAIIWDDSKWWSDNHAKGFAVTVAAGAMVDSSAKWSTVTVYGAKNNLTCNLSMRIWNRLRIPVRIREFRIYNIDAKSNHTVFLNSNRYQIAAGTKSVVNANVPNLLHRKFDFSVSYLTLMRNGQWSRVKQTAKNLYRTCRGDVTLLHFIQSKK